MTDFTPAPEAVEAVAKRIFAQNASPGFRWETIRDPGRDLWRINARAAIAAFVEAEGLEIHTTGYKPETGDTQVRGPWRKRD